MASQPTNLPPLLNTQPRRGAPLPAPTQLLLVLRVAWCAAPLALLANAAMAGSLLPTGLAGILHTLTLAGLLVMLGEGLLALVYLLRHSWANHNAPYTTLRVRLPQPDGLAVAQPTDGAALFHALHQVFDRSGRGAQPWLALTLSARPDQPAACGAVIGGGSEVDQNRWAHSFGQVISGLYPAAVVDRPNDPLQDALYPPSFDRDGVAHVLWREYRLHLPAAYPLRTPDGTSDPLGPLLAALRPQAKGVELLELQVVLRPRYDWATSFGGWRTALHRRLGQLKAGDGLALQPETQALSNKLNSPAYDTTLRLLAATDDLAAARRAFDGVHTALGQFTAPGGRGAQRLVPGAEQHLTTRPALQKKLILLPSRMIYAAAGLLSALLLALGSLLGPRLAGALPLLALPPLAWPLLAFSGLLCLALLPWIIARYLDKARFNVQARMRQSQAVRRLPIIRPLQPILLPLPFWQAPAVLSSAELAGLWHLPTAALGNLAAWLPCRHLPAPAHAYATHGERRLVLGHAQHADGTLAPVGPTLRDLRTILHITAGMGTGKSRLLANLCTQLFDDGFVLIDGKGDDSGNLCQQVVKLLRPEDEERVVLFDITDRNWSIGINPLAGVSGQPGGIDLAVARVQSVFARIDPEGWSAAPGMQQFLDMATRLVVGTVATPTLALVRRALVDEGYRRALLATCPHPELRRFWEQTYPSSSEQQKSSLHALLRRFDKLLLTDVVRSMVVQPTPAFSFDAAIANQLIVLAPIPHMTYGPLAATAAMLMFQAFLQAAFARPGDAQQRHDYPLLIDEFQILVEQGASQDVATALSQLRSLGVPAVYAHQALGQLGELRDLMLVNAEHRVILRTQEPDASTYATLYPAAGLRPADLSGQPPHEHQYARFTINGTPAGPLSITPLPWPDSDDPATSRNWRMTRLPTPATAGPPWYALLPADVPAASTQQAQRNQQLRAYDSELSQLLTNAPTDGPQFLALAKRLASADEQQWALLNERWQAIAATRRQALLADPEQLPNQRERVRWLSRLAYATPRLLAEAAALRT